MCHNDKENRLLAVFFVLRRFVPGYCPAGFTLDTYAHMTINAQLKVAQTMGNILSCAV